MKTCPKMKAIVFELCEKHGIDLQQERAHIRLDMPGFDRLCIERISGNAVSVAHYFEMNGDLVAEPDIVFFIDTQGYWIPVEITQSMTGWSRVVEFSEDGTNIARFQRQRQADIAEFAEDWAQNLRDQAWLTNATRHVYEHERVDDADDDLPPWDIEEGSDEHA